MTVTLVTVAAFDNVLEAGYWRGLLEAQGIPVVLADQEIVAANWQILRAVGNIKLQVPEPEARRASGILDALRKAHPYTPPEESVARRALRVALLGFVFAPLQLYSLWLLGGLVRRWRALSPRDRRRVWFAALADLWLPFLAFAFLAY